MKTTTILDTEEHKSLVDKMLTEGFSVNYILRVLKEAGLKLSSATLYRYAKEHFNYKPHTNIPQKLRYIVNCFRCGREIHREEAHKARKNFYCEECFNIIYFDSDYEPTDEEIENFFAEPNEKGESVTITKSILCNH